MRRQTDSLLKVKLTALEVDFERMGLWFRNREPMSCLLARSLSAVAVHTHTHTHLHTHAEQLFGVGLAEHHH